MKNFTSVFYVFYTFKLLEWEEILVLISLFLSNTGNILFLWSGILQILDCVREKSKAVKRKLQLCAAERAEMTMKVLAESCVLRRPFFFSFYGKDLLLKYKHMAKCWNKMTGEKSIGRRRFLRNLYLQCISMSKADTSFSAGKQCRES